jgi:hypothetical protein
MRTRLFGRHCCVMAVFVFVLMVGTSPSFADVTLFSDTFNSENSGTPVLNYTGFANWNVAGYVDLIGSGSGGTAFDFYPGHGLYVDMGGSGNTAGTLTTKNPFNLGPGDYTLQFDIAGSARGYVNTINMSFVSGVSGSFLLPSNSALTTHTYFFTLSSPESAYLSFEDVIGNPGSVVAGGILDNVIVTQVTGGVPSVPEPLSILFLGLGLVALGGARTRLKK